MRGYDSFKSAPVPKARADDTFTAFLYADTDRKGLHHCRSTRRSSKS